MATKDHVRAQRDYALAALFDEFVQTNKLEYDDEDDWPQEKTEEYDLLSRTCLEDWNKRIDEAS